MNWVEEQRFQEIDKIVREICDKMGRSYLDSAKILLAWCKEQSKRESGEKEISCNCEVKL